MSVQSTACPSDWLSDWLARSSTHHPQIVVTTVDVVRYSFLINTDITAHIPLLLVRTTPLLLCTHIPQSFFFYSCVFFAHPCIP